MRKPTQDQPAKPLETVWVVDQIEEGEASIEVDGRGTFTVPLWLLPQGVREGDVLAASIGQDPQEKARRLDKSKAQVAVKSKNDRPGDIVL